MGFFGAVGQRVRGLLQWDKERVVLSLAKGGTASTFPQTGFDLLQSYGYDVMSDYLKLEHDLMSRFVDYEEMDEYGELATALDIYADDATQTESLNNKVVWADSGDRTVKEVLNDLLNSRLRLGDEEAFSMARTLAKYGSEYEEMIVTNDGLVALNFLPPATMRRIEGRRGELFGFVQDFKGRMGYSPDEFKQLLAQRVSGGGDLGQADRLTALEDWEVCHMRLRTKQRRSIYGSGVLEPARWVWKRLMLLEDASLVYKLQRSPQRYAFYVDVGDMPPREAFAYLNKFRQMYKKQKFINPTTGKLDLKYAAHGNDEDFFVPIRKGVQATKIDVLNGPMWDNTELMEYFRLKMFGAIKVPKNYLGFDAPTGKSTASSEDVRFARTVMRLQRELRNGFSKMSRVHLAALNINPASVDYEIYMTVPSSVFELAQLEVRNAKADFAARMSQFVSMHWILEKIFGLSSEEIEYIIKERHEEQLADAEIQAKAMGMNAQEQGNVQMQQQMQQAQLGQAAANLSNAEPGTKKQEDASRRLRELASMSRIWPLRRQQLGYRPITERELFQGNRDHEKRLEDNMDKIMSENEDMAERLDDLKGLVNEIRTTLPFRR